MRYEEYTYPAYDAPLVSAYGGRFESLYVILHPFVRVPDSLAWWATKLYPDDEVIVSQGAKCSWAEVAAATLLPTCSKLNQALLTSIHSVGEELRDYAASSILRGFLESFSVWMPGEGRFEPLLQKDFLDIFAAAGQNELVFVPEFPRIDSIRQVSAARLRTQDEPFPHRGTLVAPDESFLLTVDWDSFFTLFFGPHDFVEAVAQRQNLEGFIATPTMEHFWFNYSLGCSVVTVAPEVWPAGSAPR